MRRILREFQNQSISRIQEMAVVGRRDADKDLPQGMRLEVVTSEYIGTGEEPHMHLYPASHKDRTGKANNYDLIARVKVTENPPKNPGEVVSIKDNKAVPKEYRQAIYEWANQSNKYGVNNWIAVKMFWEAINNRGN